MWEEPKSNMNDYPNYVLGVTKSDSLKGYVSLRYLSHRMKVYVWAMVKGKHTKKNRTTI